MDDVVKQEVERYTRAALKSLDSTPYFRLSYLRGELKKHLPASGVTYPTFVALVVEGIAKHPCLDLQHNGFVLSRGCIPHVNDRSMETMAAKCTVKAKAYVQRHPASSDAYFPVLHVHAIVQKCTSADRRSCCKLSSEWHKTLPWSLVSDSNPVLVSKIGFDKTADAPHWTMREKTVDSIESLVAILAFDPAFQSHSMVAVSCELSVCHFTSLATCTTMYHIDCLASGGVSAVVKVLRPHFENAQLTKVWFDVHADAVDLHAHVPGLCLAGTWDLQV
ncbi:Aste57867_14002 [Aphanomyces stellatus]|uniref:Aste57867_14002 protein n=1 Tax=Aphanomyces stellatus TaxID=120398 RepID=A0A485KZL8_9STRA|nr:hypothetical protein As57867_013951 [Aphanomyces stellatus]VFT90832.1 Aste57867_14002 [Aphanomyces stellatus]